MRQPNGIPRIQGLIIAFFLFALASNDARAQEIELWAYGPALANENIRQALMQAVDWEYLTGSIFESADVIVVLYPDVEESEALDNYSLGFDPEWAYDLLHQTEYSKGFELILLYNKADPKIVQIAEGIADSLWDLNIGVKLLEAEDENELEEGETYLYERENLNSLVLWLLQ